MTARERSLGFLLAVLLPCSLSLPANAAEPFRLAADDVVVFMGSANMLHLQQAGYLETILTLSQTTGGTRFRDLSWEADTVYRQGTVIERWRPDGFGGRTDQFKRIGTTVAIAQFGQLESMAGPDHLERFVKSYNQLIDELGTQARLLVLVTPTPFERPANPLVPDLSRHNPSLALYVKAIRAIADEHELVFVDLFSQARSGLTENGMHVRPAAQQQLARQIAGQLGLPLPPAKEMEPLRQAVIEKHRLWYDYWRPANWKLLYGDDSRRQFTRGGENHVPFREEWAKLLPLIRAAEHRIGQIAQGKEDPGQNRPQPEKLHADPDASLRDELAAFSVPDGFKVNLFASEADGLTSPLNIRWDPAGRMYVTVTTTYPHVFPGDVPNDKIILLEDRDDDGRADRSTVFADGLNIPTGLEWGEGGIYVGQNTELLFLEDTDGDGRSDRRRVVLGGFGNGDTHQTINSFTWSPAGELFFGQGDGCESRVETPWGASNLFQAGFYRFRPRRLQLHPLLDENMGPGNPWGVAF
ncbi:MAG: PVC-type heme-binding CxxCH protein, partial [Planctomycetota bacterium]|nr:PVC-type heme-binding CxxCH protein [Planctomycetota bacterium]